MPLICLCRENFARIIVMFPLNLSVPMFTFAKCPQEPVSQAALSCGCPNQRRNETVRQRAGKERKKKKKGKAKKKEKQRKIRKINSSGSHDGLGGREGEEGLGWRIAQLRQASTSASGPNLPTCW